MIRILIILLFFCKIGASQSTNDTLCLMNLPIKSGYILKYKEFNYGGVSDPSNYIYIYSKSKEVYAIRSGILKTQFKIGTDNFIGIESNDTLIVYGKIRTFKKNGEYFAEGEKIGDLVDLSKELFALIFGIGLVKQNVNLNYIELFDYLKLNSSLQRLP